MSMGGRVFIILPEQMSKEDRSERCVTGESPKTRRTVHAK